MLYKNFKYHVDTMIATKIELFIRDGQKKIMPLQHSESKFIIILAQLLLLFCYLVMCRRVGYLKLNCQEPGISQK